MANERDVVTVERVIPAPAEKIFAVLADPSQHPVIDGSGTVQHTKGEAATRVGLGDTFGMSMRMGVPYSMENVVTEFEPGRRIAWSARPPGWLSKYLAGRTWRYELEPVEGGTRVRESWDISTDKQAFLLRRGYVRSKTRENMEKTLERLEAHVTGA